MRTECPNKLENERIALVLKQIAKGMEYVAYVSDTTKTANSGQNQHV
jgi:hypothetical protein